MSPSYVVSNVTGSSVATATAGGSRTAPVRSRGKVKRTRNGMVAAVKLRKQIRLIEAKGVKLTQVAAAMKVSNTGVYNFLNGMAVYSETRVEEMRRELAKWGKALAAATRRV